MIGPRPVLPALRGALTDRELPEAIGARKSMLCRLGRHHYLVRSDDNAERRGGSYLQCLRCGRRHDPPEYGPPSATTMGNAAML